MFLTRLLIISHFSIVIPAFLSLFKINHAIKFYLPFVLFMWIGLLNETISYVFIIKSQSNMINSNIYTLIEYFIILAQFAVWNGKPVKQYILFAIGGLLIWLLDNVYLHTLTDNNSIFRLSYSLVIVLFSLDQYNKVITYEKGRLITNATFLMCSGFILYFGCKAFLESFNIFHVGLSGLFLGRIFFILSMVNFLANLLYSLSILCIPKKREFSLPY